MQQIKSFGILQTAKFSAAMYFVIGAVFAIPMAVISILTAVIGGQSNAWFGVLFIFVPIFYAVIGFAMMALMCWVYNLVAGWIGGIEIELG